jgi:hypothetical protein
MSPDSPRSPKRPTDDSRGYCPVCGGAVLWTPTAHLWPSKRLARSVLPSQSGVCPQCHRILMYTVMNEAAEDSRGGQR